MSPHRSKTVTKTRIHCYFCNTFSLCKLCLNCDMIYQILLFFGMEENWRDSDTDLLKAHPLLLWHTS